MRSLSSDCSISQNYFHFCTENSRPCMGMSLLLLLSHFQQLSVNLAVSRRKAAAFNSSPGFGSSSVSISQCRLLSGSSEKVSCFLWSRSPANLFSEEVHALGNICSFKTFSFTTCPLVLYMLAQLTGIYWFVFFLLMFYLVGEGQQSVEVRRQLRGVCSPTASGLMANALTSKFSLQPNFQNLFLGWGLWFQRLGFSLCVVPALLELTL